MNNNLFGTDGIRNRVGQDPFSLKQLPCLGRAIATWAHNKYTNSSTTEPVIHPYYTPSITQVSTQSDKQPIGLIACDTRISCSYIKTALMSSMLLHNITVIDLGILPTPAVFAFLKNQNMFHFGMVISASHNPYQDNGIKLIDAYDGKLTEHDEQTISSLFYSDTESTRYDQFGTSHLWHDAAQQYCNHIIRQFKPNFLKNITLVIDCAHGATYSVAPIIFNALGAHTITIHNSPNGTNINHQCGALHPEQLVQQVQHHNADIGIAFDGDGDRVVLVNKNGEIKNGDDCIALLALHPRYKNQHTVVGTIMSNEGLAVHLQTHNKQFIRTAVGDKHISAHLKTHNLLLGGEQSGHIIMHDYSYGGDGIFTALSILESAIESDNMLLNTFIKYPQILINIPVLAKKDLTHQPYATLISHYAKQLSNGRLEVRYSGTENLLRVMVECTDQETAFSIGNQLADSLKKQLFIT